MKEKKKKKDEEIREEVWLDRPEDDPNEYPQEIEDARRLTVVTTTIPRPPKKKTIVTTRDLPSTLPNYHGVKGEEKND